MLDHLEKSFSGNKLKLIYSFTDAMVSILRKTQPEGCSQINATFESYLTDDEKLNTTIDSIRHSFFSYCVGGIHDLYCNQENEDWYPPVELTECLYPNDNDKLPEIITIYRGCCVDEYDNQSFGQAWTTDIEIAKTFAYIHYSNQSWFDKRNRIVCQANIANKDVLFSRI